MTDIPKNITIIIDGKEYTAKDIAMNCKTNTDRDINGWMAPPRIIPISMDITVTIDGLKEKE